MFLQWGLSQAVPEQNANIPTLHMTRGVIKLHTGTMWALVKDQPAKGLSMKRVEIPAVGDNDVMIKIHKTAICGTDVHIWDWNEWAQNTFRVGTTAGHEYVGEIVEMGAAVKGHHLGELVSGEGHIVCGMCRNCRSGRGHLCKNTSGVGVNRNGAFAEYLVIPASNVISCSPKIPEELYSIFDPFGNATHTALSFNLLAEDVLVTGAGPIGILAAAIAKFSGARHVVITDLNEYRLELARQFGVMAVNTKETDLKEVMADLGIHEGFDVGMEMSGNPIALRQLIESMYNGGRIALLGLPNKNAVELPLNTIIWNGLILKGIYGREMDEPWYKMPAMVEAGFPLEKIITHRFPVQDYKQGFEAMCSGHSGKVILDWTGLQD